MNNKGQGMQGMFIGLGVAAIVIIIIVVVFSNVSRTADTNIPRDTGSVINETVVPSANTYVTFANAEGTCSNILEIYNTTGDTNEFIASGNYTISGCSINVTCDYGETCFVNSTGIGVSYTYQNDTTYVTSLEGIRATGLNSLSLGTVALIVLAAVAILGIVMGLGRG